jgi:hypothetical protein
MVLLNNSADFFPVFLCLSTIALISVSLESDIGLEINPQKIFEFAMGNRYGVASERILNAFKDSVKKNL